MKKYFKKYWLFSIIALSFYVTLMCLVSVRLANYELVTIGPIKQVSTDEIIVETSYEEKGSLNTVSVWTFERPTIFQYLLQKTRKDYYLVKHEPSYSFADARVSGYASKDMSNTNSVRLAYEEAGAQLDGYVTPVIYKVYKEPYLNGTLPLGQKGATVLKVNSTDVSNVEEVRDLLAQGTCGDKYELTLEVNQQTTTYEIQSKIVSSGDSLVCSFGIVLYDRFHITNSNPKVTIVEDPNTFGGSGGLMQTLAIYNKLTKDDITKGYTIVGTGTIDINGNVGPIGAAYQKFHSAHYKKAKVFFVLDSDKYDNYSEALRAKKDLNSSVEVVAVKTFSDAVAYLKGMN